MHLSRLLAGAGLLVALALHAPLRLGAGRSAVTGSGYSSR